MAEKKGIMTTSFFLFLSLARKKLEIEIFIASNKARRSS